ncbi:lipopolysaccharide biosynthesis protein [Luteirhabdus pelagi]|uniref:lipopolysaccharide biosynthesis protein n=1 Tax=Luteirhabdus pelagi TaxID=2792783 RepID=UPI001F3E44DC|nr:polysaccharide biosynthesis protein [Luteirhabdus pelagi]
MIQKLQALFNSDSEEAPKLLSVLIDQVFMSLTTLLTTVILARTYDKLVYADYVLLLSITLFTLGLQSSFISKPYAINLSDFKEKNSFDFYNFNISLKYVFTLFILLVFPLAYYFLFDNWDTSALLHYLFYIVAYTFYFFVRETLLSERKTRQNLYYGLGCSLGLLTLLGIIYFNEIAQLEFFLKYASLIYLGVTAIYLIRNSHSVFKFRERYRSFFHTNWKVGRWLVGSNFLFHLSSNIYPWLLLLLSNKSNVAVLGVLMSIGSLISPLLTALNSYLLPLFVKLKLNYSRIHALVRRWLVIFGGLALLLVTVGYFLGQDIMVLVFGEKYADLGLLVLYPFIVQAINVAFQPFKIALDAVKRTDVNFWILIPRSLIAVGLGYFLIHQYGLVGAFYTMIIENLLYRLLHFFIYTRIINRKGKKTIVSQHE